MATSYNFKYGKSDRIRFDKKDGRGILKGYITGVTRMWLSEKEEKTSYIVQRFDGRIEHVLEEQIIDALH